MEASGIEPESQDNVNGGFYAFSRSFNLNANAEDQHSSSESRRLYLAIEPTSAFNSQLANFGPTDRKHPRRAEAAYVRQP